MTDLPVRITDGLHQMFRQTRSAVLFGMTGTSHLDADGVTKDEAIDAAADLIKAMTPLFEVYAPIAISPDTVRVWLRRTGWTQVHTGRASDTWVHLGGSEAVIPSEHASDFRRRWPEMWDWLSELTGRSVPELMDAVRAECDSAVTDTRQE